MTAEVLQGYSKGTGRVDHSTSAHARNVFFTDFYTVDSIGDYHYVVREPHTCEETGGRD